MFCKNCGNKLDENQKFCNKCGSKVQDDNEIKDDIDLEEKSQIEVNNIDNDLNNANQVSKSKKKSNVVFIIVLILLILVIIGLIVFITIKVINNNSNISNNKEIINKKDVDIEDDDDEIDNDETIIVANYKFTKLDKFKYATKEDTLYVTDQNKENILSAMEFLSTPYDEIKLEADAVKQELIDKGYTINKVVNQTFGSHEFLAYDVTYSGNNCVLFYVSIDSATTVCGSLQILSSYTYTQGLTDISEILLYSNKENDEEEEEISDFSVKIPDSSSNSFNLDLK